jgi:glucuronide carrier protein
MVPETSGCRVVTIAFTDGARAEEIGRRVAADLGFRYVDDLIVERAAEMAGVTPAEVAAVEHSQPLMARILTALAMSVAPDIDSVALAEADQSPAYRTLIQEVIRRTADGCGVVIGAHGAGILLANRPDTVRVLITGSPTVRARRMATERGIAERDALKAAARADHERAAYLCRFYDLHEELPTHYDLVLNTDTLTPERAVRIIHGAGA